MSPKSPIVLAACLAGLVGCSSVPSFGPERDSFINAANRSEPPFTLVEITPAVVGELSRFPILSLAGRFPDHRPSLEPTIGIGDSLQVTVYEAASGGLFSNASTSAASPGAKTASVPPQVVANDGAISIPFGGRLRVVGLTIPQVEKAVVSRLEGKAIEPQAIVKLVLNISGSVSVTGDAMNRAARVPLNVGGDRILDVIAQAGGASTPVNETYVDLIRGGVTARVPMQKVVAEPSENIYARPGDNIVVWLHPPTFTVLGATSENAVIPFDAAGLSLQEAIGRSGGLKDDQADPGRRVRIALRSSRLGGTAGARGRARSRFRPRRLSYRHAEARIAEPGAALRDSRQGHPVRRQFAGDGFRQGDRIGQCRLLARLLRRLYRQDDFQFHDDGQYAIRAPSRIEQPGSLCRFVEFRVFFVGRDRRDGPYAGQIVFSAHGCPAWERSLGKHAVDAALGLCRAPTRLKGSAGQKPSADDLNLPGRRPLIDIPLKRG